MVSSILSSNKSTRKSSGSNSKKQKTDEQDSGFVTICMTIFIFRGQPYDVWNRRHVLLYFTSPDLPDFHETVHAQRPGSDREESEDDETAQTVDWTLDRVHDDARWFESRTYLNHVNAGAVVVQRGQEMVPVDIVAAVLVTDRPRDWNCQHFVCEGLQELVNNGLYSQESYDLMLSDLMDKLLEGTVG